MDSQTTSNQSDGDQKPPENQNNAAGADAKTKLTGFSMSLEVMVFGDQEKPEIEQVTEAATAATAFLDGLREQDGVRLIKIGSQKFSTRSLDAQP